MANKKQINLGFYTTKLEASYARRYAEILLNWPECQRRSNKLKKFVGDYENKSIERFVKKQLKKYGVIKTKEKLNKLGSELEEQLKYKLYAQLERQINEQLFYQLGE